MNRRASFLETQVLTALCDTVLTTNAHFAVTCSNENADKLFKRLWFDGPTGAHSHDVMSMLPCWFAIFGDDCPVSGLVSDREPKGLQRSRGPYDLFWCQRKLPAISGVPTPGHLRSILQPPSNSKCQVCSKCPRPPPVTFLRSNLEANAARDLHGLPEGQRREGKALRSSVRGKWKLMKRSKGQACNWCGYPPFLILVDLLNAGI